MSDLPTRLAGFCRAAATGELTEIAAEAGCGDASLLRHLRLCQLDFLPYEHRDVAGEVACDLTQRPLTQLGSVAAARHGAHPLVL